VQNIQSKIYSSAQCTRIVRNQFYVEQRVITLEIRA